MGRATAFFFGRAPWSPGEGSKGHISFNFNYKVNFKFLYVLTNERYKTSDGILILLPGSCPRGWTLGRWGAEGVKHFFFKHDHVAYLIEGDDEQNRMQVSFSSKGLTGDLGVRSNITEFSFTCQFQRFLYHTLCVLYK